MIIKSANNEFNISKDVNMMRTYIHIYPHSLTHSSPVRPSATTRPLSQNEKPKPKNQKPLPSKPPLARSLTPYQQTYLKKINQPIILTLIPKTPPPS